MTLFVDASALAAIIENEQERSAMIAELDAATDRLWSPLSCWETVSALQSSYQRPIEWAREAVAAHAKSFHLSLVAIGADELAIALDAYQTYGTGRHRAKLNFGDCFAYACAKTHGAKLLYKGDDFVHTDLA